jgi:hypothetical protein
MVEMLRSSLTKVAFPTIASRDQDYYQYSQGALDVPLYAMV